MVKNCDIKYFLDFADLDVFKGIIAYPSIIVAGREKKPLLPTQYCYFEDLDTTIETYFKEHVRLYPQEKIKNDV